MVVVVTVLVVMLALFGYGFYRGARYGGKLSGAAPRPSRAPHPDGKGWDPTAVYVYLDADQAVLYAGISSAPQIRARQHWDAPDEVELCSQVANIRAHWFPDRYAALCVEWALIHYFDPPYNKARSGSCDAWTQPRPPIVPVTVKIPRRRALARSLR